LLLSFSSFSGFSELLGFSELPGFSKLLKLHPSFQEASIAWYIFTMCLEHGDRMSFSYIHLEI
jgi:hypothetical protein